MPETLTQVKVALPLPATKRSPMRPPQPDAAPSGDCDCQYDCWSLCENSLGGNGTDPAVYCALVVGWTSVPTLSITPSLPALKIGSSGASSGAIAYWRPFGSATEGTSVVAVSALAA